MARQKLWYSWHCRNLFVLLLEPGMDISFDFQVGLQRLGRQPLTSKFSEMFFFWGWLITTVFQNDLNLPLGEDRCGYFHGISWFIVTRNRSGPLVPGRLQDSSPEHTKHWKIYPARSVFLLILNIYIYLKKWTLYILNRFFPNCGYGSLPFHAIFSGLCWYLLWGSWKNTLVFRGERYFLKIHGLRSQKKQVYFHSRN